MTKMSFETARFNMVEQQIRPWKVLDTGVLDLISHAPRHEYVPDNYRKFAFVDMSIPLGEGWEMMEPKVEARLLQSLEIQPIDTILEVGTGCGYMTSLLATLGKHVYSLDNNPEWSTQAGKNLAAHGIKNVTLEVGDAHNGWDAHQPYNVIMINGSLPKLPEAFGKSLTIGGRMVAIIGKSPVMEAKLIQRVGENNWTKVSLFETELARLPNVEEPKRFIF